MFFTRPASRKSSARVSKADHSRRRKLFFESLEDRRVLAPVVLPGYEAHVVTSGGALAGRHLGAIVTDPSTGNLFVASDTGNPSVFAVHKVTPAGSVSLLGSYGNGRSIELQNIARGPDGGLYYATTSSTIARIDPVTGATTTYNSNISPAPSSGRHGLDWSPTGQLIYMNEAAPNSFYRLNAGSGATFLGSYTMPIFEHGDRFGIQPDGDYAVFPDSSSQNYVFELDTTGHVDGTSYPLNYLAGTDIQTLGNGFGHSNGTIDPVSGDVYTAGGRFGAGSSTIVFTPGNGTFASVSSIFVSNIGTGGINGSGGTGLDFGPRTDGAPGNGLFFLDDITDTVYEVRLAGAQTDVVVSGGVVTVTDAQGGTSNDTLRLSSDGTNLYVEDTTPANTVGAGAGATQVNPNKVSIPLASISSIVVNTLAGNDILTVDASLKTSGKPITYDGGNPTTGPGDQLKLESAATPVTTTTYNYTNANSGNVSIDGYVVTYTGLEPITSTINAVNVILNYSTTAEILTVISAGAGSTNVSSNVAAETTTFANPTGTLTINAGDTGGDTINVNGLGSGFNANLTIDGEAGNDIVNFAGAVNLGAGNLNVTAETINSNATVTTTGAAVLSANSGAITDGNGSSVNIAAASLVATATTGISLDTTVANLEASGGSGGVTINETDGLTIGGIGAVDGVSATGGSISVIASGTITVNEPVSNTGGGSVSLTAGGAGGSSNLLFVGDDTGRVGTYDLVSTATAPLGNLNAFGISQVIGIAYDPGSNAVLILDRSSQRVFTMNAVSGVGSLLFNTGGITFQGGAVKNGLLYGIDENTQTVEAFSIPGGVNQGFVSGAIPGHTHGMGIDPATGQLYVGGNPIRQVDNSGNSGAAVVAHGTNIEDLEFFNGNYLVAPYSNEVRLVNGVTGASSTFLSPAQVAAMGLTSPVSGVALAGGGSVSADLTLNASVSASGGNGNVTLNATNSILQNSGSVTATSSGLVDYNASTGTSNGAITMADGTSATSGTGLISLDAKGNIQVSLLQTGSAAGNAVTVTTTAGAITDADAGAALDISAVNGGAILSAATGIGAAGSNATIEINVINLDVHNNTSGGIFVTDTAGGLTLTNLSGPTSVSGVGGNGLITANSPLTIAASATTSGGMTYTATDSAGAGDNLTINAGVAVTDTTASLTFNAGDDFLLTNTASISAATTVTINIDAGNADSGVGATANIFGALAASGGAGINGNADSDTFNITGPTVGALDSITAAVTVNGGAGVNNLNLSDANDATGDIATITQSTVEGLGGSPGTDYTFSNIANLDVTAGSDADSLTTNLGGAVASPTNFNGLVNVNVRGNGGADNMFLHVADSLTDASLDFVRLFGDAGGDNFGGSAPANHIHPVLASGQTQIIINGDAEAKLGPGALNPGTTGTITGPDHLFLDLTKTDSGATVNPIVIVDTNGGYADAANTQSFRYNGIEDIDLYDNGVLTNTAIGDFFLRATNNPDYILFMSAAQVNPTFRIRIGNQYYPTNGGQYGPYTTGSSNVFVYGQGGNDTISMYNTRLNAAFFGEEGHDILTGGYGNDLLVGGAGNDRINGGTVGGNDTIWGDDFNPATDDPAVASQTSLGGNDQINTFGGSDTIYGQGGNDIINSGAGDDYINGGAGDDLIDGQAGNDRIYGGAGNDVMSGSDGNDLIAGNDGNDTLNGRTGNDILIGGLGQDILNGHEGGDALVGDESNGSGSKSLAKDDAVDVALTALLLAWGSSPTLGNLSGLDSSGADGSEDTLYGGAAADAFFGLGALLDKAPDRNAPGYGPDLN